MLEATNGRGVDVVLDCIGGSYLASNVSSLAFGGSLGVIGLMGATRGELDLTALSMKRAWIVGSTLRARSVDEKARSSARSSIALTVLSKQAEFVR